MEDINRIFSSESVQSDKQSPNVFERRKKKKKKHYKRAVKHLSELTRIVGETHKELEKKDSPFRLCVYEDGEDTYIDIVIVDESGETRQVLKHDISNDELEELIAHIKSGRGLLLDADA